MTDHAAAMTAYVHLAALSFSRRQTLPCGRFLAAAAVSATRAGWLDVAADCRTRLLQLNPHHFFNAEPSLPELLRRSDLAEQIAHAVEYCPFERAEQLLDPFNVSPLTIANDVESSLGDRLLAVLADIVAKPPG